MICCSRHGTESPCRPLPSKTLSSGNFMPSRTSKVLLSSVCPSFFPSSLPCVLLLSSFLPFFLAFCPSVRHHAIPVLACLLVVHEFCHRCHTTCAGEMASYKDCYNRVTEGNFPSSNRLLAGPSRPPFFPVFPFSFNSVYFSSCKRACLQLGCLVYVAASPFRGFFCTFFLFLLSGFSFSLSLSLPPSLPLYFPSTISRRRPMRTHAKSGDWVKMKK